MAIGALAIVTLVIILLIARASGVAEVPRAPAVVRVAPRKATPVPRPRRDRIRAVGSADGGGYFNPNCRPPLHWVMAVARCVPPWKPGEP